MNTANKQTCRSFLNWNGEFLVEVFNSGLRTVQKISIIKQKISVLLLLGCAVAASAVELKSPDGKVVVHFDLKTFGDATNCPTYSVSYAGCPVLADSRLGLELRESSMTSDFKITGAKESSSDTTWKPVLAERETIRDHFNQVVIDLQQATSSARQLQITLRAYNEGVAFSYTLPLQPGMPHFVITREVTQFAFTGDYTTWAVYRAQGNYDPADPRRKSKAGPQGPVAINEIKPGVERPLTVRVATNLYAAVTEARLVDFARMKFCLTLGATNSLEALLDGEVKGQTPFTSPWRVVMLAETPGKLLEQNYLVLNLNDPCALADTSWIKPGKVIRESTLTTVGGKACVDFALKHNLQFIEYDAGWYGFQYDAASDARDVHLDPTYNPVPDSLNLREVINYANSNGVGVILYVNQRAMEKQLNEILPIYESWGVRGVKYGFVNVGSQRWTAWLHEAIRQAAAHHLMVDIHDEFRSTGYQRTYPNLMTCEGVCGNEEFPTPVHNATLPFTRFLTGPADVTYCWDDQRLKNTKAHQMALSTIFFSPWQFLFWYDKPAQVKDEPALDYWKNLPTTWDETRVLQGEIGRRAVVARRKGGEWFVGAIAPVDGKFPIALDFLAPEKKFTAKIYCDQPDGQAVRIEKRPVDRQSVIDADLLPNGGLVMRLVP